MVGGSIKNERVLMQRGLRINKTSRDLWLQCFALELHYVQKLRGRREILELRLIDEGATTSSGEEGGERGGEVAEEGEGSSLLPARVVYRNAIKAAPDDVTFRLKFVEACREFPETEELEGEFF